ncbi:hypothetical protein HAX54_018796 [Datura stramonium]|uniref:Uncharacterized protein n=1 Tax=Datura stramonium TaxID=4076 RepID=A0ABS8UMZ8_DATST|nr:hypothetical protein [Datura stramonium]
MLVLQTLIHLLELPVDRLARDNHSVGKTLNFIPPIVKDGIITVLIEEDDIKDKVKQWEHALIGYLLGDTPTGKQMKDYVNKVWKENWYLRKTEPNSDAAAEKSNLGVVRERRKDISKGTSKKEWRIIGPKEPTQVEKGTKIRLRSHGSTTIEGIDQGQQRREDLTGEVVMHSAGNSMLFTPP